VKGVRPGRPAAAARMRGLAFTP